MRDFRNDEERRDTFQEEALPYLDAVYRFALRLSGSADRAEDLVQDTFLRAYRSWHQYKPGTSCKSWLFTICRNVFLRGEERSQRHDEIVAREAGGNPLEVEMRNPLWARVAQEDPQGDFFGKLVDETVLRAIDGLPEDYRAVLVLSDVEGLSYGEIADSLDLPVGTVKSRLFRGRRQLQGVLYDYAVEMGYLSPTPGSGQASDGD
jgi:RNA polymerase sigma-70 factor (ECF subfamily)